MWLWERFRAWWAWRKDRAFRRGLLPDSRISAYRELLDQHDTRSSSIDGWE